VRKTKKEDLDDDGPKTKKRKKKDPFKPKRPKSGYVFYSKTVRDKVRAELYKQNPNAKITEVMKIVAQQWKNLNEEQKKQFDLMASQDQQRYQKEKEEYSKHLEETKDQEPPKEPKESTEKKANEKEKIMHSKYFSEPLNNIQKEHSTNGSANIQKILLIRKKGDNLFSRIGLNELSIACLKEKIRSKLHVQDDDVFEILNLPQVRINDDEDISLLPHNAELEVTLKNIL